MIGRVLVWWMGWHGVGVGKVMLMSVEDSHFWSDGLLLATHKINHVM